MTEKRDIFTRRTVIGGIVGGAAVAAAVAQTAKTGMTSTSYQDSFMSPYFSLARADHSAWKAEVGTTLQVMNGPTYRIAAVETFASYGDTDTNLLRSRAFLVDLQQITRGLLVGNRIHRVTHSEHGSFDLFLVNSPAYPGLVQAVFN